MRQATMEWFFLFTIIFIILLTYFELYCILFLVGEVVVVATFLILYFF
jgi:hypothetical protein